MAIFPLANLTRFNLAYMECLTGNAVEVEDGEHFAIDPIQGRLSTKGPLNAERCRNRKKF
jgi:hypothetical protein